MKVQLVLSLMVLISYASAYKACSTANRDCSCKDVSYQNCHDPPAIQELHVGDLGECIQNCDLFGSFGQCQYLIYYGDTGHDENCKLIADSTIDVYLHACRVFGQPLRDPNGNCMQGFESEQCSLMGCNGVLCHACDVDDRCGLYAETECLKEGPPGETFPTILDFKTCLNLCTSQQQSNPFTYVVYDKESQECICYPDGLRSCQITVVPYGLSLIDAEHCGGCVGDSDCSSPTPICSPLTGRCIECLDNTDCATLTAKPICDTDENICVEDRCSDCVAPTAVCDTVTGTCKGCLVDSDCTAPEHCDQGTNECKPECIQDTDCNAEDYCHCPQIYSTDDCSTGGTCQLGCRNVGDPCIGSTLTCNGAHQCVQSGDSLMTKMTIVTRNCDGCSSYRQQGVAGAIVSMKADALGGEKTCSTNILDNTDSIDYAGQKDFENYETLGECLIFGLSSPLTYFSVTWAGPGTWTPEKFILERGNAGLLPYCCFNNDGLTVSAGPDVVVFECIAASSALGVDCQQ